jgi:membrane protease YdiL (CAAX protease family)
MLWKKIKNVLFYYLLIYLLGSFIALSFNPAHWDIFNESKDYAVIRFMIGIVSVVISLIIWGETGGG